MIKIQKIVKKGKKYQLYISSVDEQIITTVEDVIIKYGILKPKEIDEKTYQKILDDVKYYDYLYSTFAYLLKLRSTYDVYGFLHRQKCPLEIQERIVSLCVEKKLIDDYLLAECLVEYHNKRDKGPAELRKILDGRGLSVYADELISRIRPEEHVAKLEKMFSKILTKNMSKKQMILSFKKKAYEKGYDTTTINDVAECLSGKLQDVDERKSIEHDYKKARNHYEKKFSDNILKQKVIESLLRKGYSLEKIKVYFTKELF